MSHISSKYKNTIGSTLTAVLLLAGPFAAAEDKNTQPWSEIAVGAAGAANPDVDNVIVLAIDGSMEFDRKRAYRMAPGVHFIELASTKIGRRGDMTRQPFLIETKPCVRYELVATHTQSLSNTRWSPTVKAEKPITGCAEKFKIAPVISEAPEKTVDEAAAPSPPSTSTP